MRSLDILTLCFCLVCFVNILAAKKGFILTAPKSIDAGSTEYFTFTAFEVPPGGQVHLKLRHYYTGDLIAQSTLNVLSNINMWVEMSIPPSTSDVRGRLRVEGVFSDGYRIDAEKEVLIRHNSVIGFVQTDKPVYKPGQSVRFRVLPMDSQLKPLEENSMADIWIEDPNGIRVAQWKQIRFAQGMVQLELPLSTEPPLGTWNIKTTVNQVASAQKFEVEKYVLPKFEVKVNPPAVVMADADVLPVEICAWYTYGKKVEGTVKVRVTYKKYAWEGRRRAIPSAEHTGTISGCYSLDVNTQDILLQTREFGYRTIEIFAEVTENATAKQANASTTVSITHSKLQLKFLVPSADSDFFKPGIPFYGELEVTRADGSPAPNERVEICAEYVKWLEQTDERRCHHFNSNKQGRIHFSVPPKAADINKIHLKAEAVYYEPVHYKEDIWQKKIERPRAAADLTPWYSASGSYLQIQPLAQDMECEKPQRVKIRYTAHKGAAIKFYHQVLSRGRIVQQGSHQRTFYSKEEDATARYDLGDSDFASNTARWLPKLAKNTSRNQIGEFLLSFDPRATMAPVARLLVFYVREDGEVVADSRMFRIDHCLLNKVSLSFRHEQQLPGSEAQMQLTAAPSSVCGIGMVDKSVRLLRKEEHFSRKNIFKVLEKYDVGKENNPHQVTEDYCMQKLSKETSTGKPETSSNASELRMFPSLARLISHHVDTAMAFEEAGMVVISNFELETRPCVMSQPIAVAYYVPSAPGSPMEITNTEKNRRVGGRSKPKARKSDAMEEESKKSSEAEEIRSYFPETWLWEMHAVGSSGQLTVKRPLPHTITQWVGGAVCVHPKAGLGVWEESGVTAFQPFFVSLHLPYSVVRGETLPLTVSVFNYLTECLPIKLALDTNNAYEIVSDSRVHRMCVCGGESRGHSFAIRPTALGMVNVTVYGFSLEDDDAMCGSEVTARLSARDAISKQLLVEAEGFPKEEVFNYFVCPENTNGSYSTEVDLLLPEDVVDGSARAYVSVSGDLMGPALQGLSRLVQMPVGCGEQNMVLFTPNIFVMDYLVATSRLTEDIRSDCISNMKTGYQRELKYRHKEGSYSAFGASDAEGSLWLTAFVLRSFGQARRFIDIDDQDLRLSTFWILERQFENGCFEPSGKLLNKAMKGGLHDGEQSLSPLTAYVLIALLESGVQRLDQPNVRNALKCMESEANPSSYALSLFAHASALAKDVASTNRYLQQLESRAVVRGGLMHWEETETGSKSVAVETAGYYVLAKTETGEGAGVVLPVIRWIARQRNSNGGFVSTQDTVVALQALARYSSLQTTKSLDMGLALDSDELVKGFKLDEDNKLLTQTVTVPVLPAVIDLQAVGEGCALVQFSLRYNVDRMVGSEAFDLNIDTIRLGSSKCNLPRIGICMRYRLHGQSSNMVVLSIKMASGLVADEESLQELQSDAKLQLKRHEIDKNQINLYFNELSNEQKCFTFFVKSEIEIEDLKPSIVRLYDYYQPELEITKEYTIPSACTVVSLPDVPWLPPLIFDTDATDQPPYDIFPVGTRLDLPVAQNRTGREETAGTTSQTTSASNSGTTSFQFQTTPTIFSVVTSEDIGIITEISSEGISESTSSEFQTQPTESAYVISDDTSSQQRETSSIAADRTNSVTEAYDTPTPATMPSQTETSYLSSESGFTSSETSSLTSRASDIIVPTSETSSFKSETNWPVETSRLTGEPSETPIPIENSETSRPPTINNEMVDITSGIPDVQTEFATDYSSTQREILIDISEEMDKESLLALTTEDHLSNFVNVDHELDFPDRLEGNMPVSLPPPVSEGPLDGFDCLTCSADFPDNFTDIYCSSAYVLILKREDESTWRIVQDVSFFNPDPKVMKEVTKVEYDGDCLCSPLQSSNSVVLLVGTQAESWNVDKNRIHLKSGHFVIQLTSETDEPSETAQARQLCNNEP